MGNENPRTTPSEQASPAANTRPPGLGAGLLRSVFGGVLMGLANLVPGISGGTMLLAAGIYPRIIGAIAELSTLTFRRASMLVLGTTAFSAFVAILLLAGPVKDLVVDQRWIMYSLFIGLTLGGVPIVWRLARPANGAVWIGAAIGLAGMVALALVQQAGSSEAGGASSSMGMLFVAGLAGASAMILPGLSGGYLLLLLGQYVPILASVDRVKTAVSDRDIGAAVAEWTVVVPVGVGVVIGILVVSNAMRFLLKRFEKPTLGVLLGLLVGAVAGLWPFQQGVAPEPGDVIKGQTVTEETLPEIEADDYPIEYFSPSGSQIGIALGLIVVGFGVTMGIARIGRDQPSDDGSSESVAS